MHAEGVVFPDQPPLALVFGIDQRLDFTESMGAVGAFEIGEFDDRDRGAGRPALGTILEVKRLHVSLFPRMSAIKDGIALGDDAMGAGIVGKNLDLDLLAL